jgi:hypothetical protein
MSDPNDEALKKRMSGLSDQELRSILAAKRSEYRPEARKFAKEELDGRRAGIRFQQTAESAQEKRVHRVTAEVLCLKARTDMKSWETDRERGKSANIHYQTNWITVERPARKTSLVTVPCPVCGAEMTMTVWSKDRILSNRFKCLMGVLISLPLVMVLVGIFPLFFLFPRMLGRHSRYGLFMGDDDRYDNQRDQKLERLLHWDHAIKPLMNS